MGALLTAIIPSLLPAIADGARGLFAKLTGSAGAQPQSVTEVIQLMNAETGRLQAMAQLDQQGNVSVWVANVRAMQRPVACAMIIGGYMYCIATLNPSVTIMADYAQMVTFYLFGDRSYAYLKTRAGK